MRISDWSSDVCSSDLTSRLVLGQEAVDTKSNETTAIPPLLERLAADGGLQRALVSIDAIACNATIAPALVNAGADYMLAVQANQPTLRAEIAAVFADAHAEIGRATCRESECQYV